jgi:transposase-like protein
MERKDTTRRTQKGQQVPDFTEDQAREYFEKLRWPGGPACVHCGSVNVTRLQGESARPGTLQCNESGCRQQFTVTVGSIMEDTHLPLSVWVRAFHYMSAGKKGISALQLQRQLGLGSYRTAWHLAHRIREAMRCEPVAGMLKGTVQADECYVGGKPRPGTGSHKRGRGTEKAPVMVLVESGPGGKAHSRHIERVDATNLKGAIREMVDQSATIHTDQLNLYRGIGEHFAGGHKSVNHSVGEYVGKDGQHTNTAESYFAILKRGVMGSFHHVSKKHLHRYCDEFAFRWNERTVTDAERRDQAVKGAEGKRLMYREPVSKGA